MRRPIARHLALILSTSTLVIPVQAEEARHRDPATDAFVQLPEAPSERFVDATATNVPMAPTLHATDSAFVDVNGDGHLDVAVSVEYGVNRLYMNDGNGKLTYRPDAFGQAIRDSEHVRTADFDGDGNMDVVFVAESDEVHQLWLGDGQGGFTDVSDRIPVRSQGNAQAVGDVNGDGLPDIVIGSTGERGHGEDMELYPAWNILYLNDPANPGYFEDVSRTHLPQGDDQTEGLALADMTGDGSLDLVFMHIITARRKKGSHLIFTWDVPVVA